MIPEFANEEEQDRWAMSVLRISRGELDAEKEAFRKDAEYYERNFASYMGNITPEDPAYEDVKQGALDQVALLPRTGLVSPFHRAFMQVRGEEQRRRRRATQIARQRS